MKIKIEWLSVLTALALIACLSLIPMAWAFDSTKATGLSDTQVTGDLHATGTVQAATLTSTGSASVSGVATLGKTGAMSVGSAVLPNRSGFYIYNAKGTRYRIYSNTTGTESAGAITAVKK